MVIELKQSDYPGRPLSPRLRRASWWTMLPDGRIEIHKAAFHRNALQCHADETELVPPASSDRRLRACPERSRMGQLPATISQPAVTLHRVAAFCFARHCCSHRPVGGFKQQEQFSHRRPTGPWLQRFTCGRLLFCSSATRPLARNGQLWSLTSAFAKR